MKKLLKHLLSFLPRKLPDGRKAFDKWIMDIVAVSGLPNNDSIRTLAARFILSLPPALAYLSIRKVSNQLVKAASNQVAAEVLEDAKRVKETSTNLVQKA